MNYLSILRVLDTDYKIKDEEAARTNHTHRVEEIEGAAKEGHQHQASEIAGLSTVATSGSYSDLSGKPSAATESADGLMTSADKKKLDGIQAGAQANADAIAAEATRAKAAESANAKAVTDEAARAKKAEADNASAIKSEAARAAKAEGANSDAVKAEADARANADAALGARIDGVSKNVTTCIGNVAKEVTDRQGAVQAEATARKSADDALSATAKGLRTDVDAATNALADKPGKTDTSMTHWLVVAQNVGKYWCRLGTLVSQGDSSTVTIHVLTGDGYNGVPSQNSELWVYIKDGFTSGAGTTYFGATVELGANCDGVEVRVFATNATTCDVWLKLPWGYPNGSYTVQGTYKSWTPNNSKDNQADPPSPAGQVEQLVATRTIASTDYVTAKLAGYQPRGDYAAKSHAHAASDVTSGVLPVARGGTGNGSGNAPTASRLASARTIALTGAVTGSAKFDGSGNVNISTTANESYISSPISGLYNMAVDADGNLWVYHSDSDKAPNFEYDPATGNLYYVTEA